MRFRIFPSILVLACAAATAAHPCHAQSESVTLRFVSFPRIADPQSVELLVGEGKILKIEIPSNELSAPYQVKRLAIWAVGKSGEDKEGKPKFNVYGKAKALSSSKQLLLLVRKGATDADGFRIIPFDNRATQFGSRKFLFLNATRIDIAGEVGAQKFTLKPGRHTIIRPVADQGKNLCHATFFYRKEKAWKSFFSSNWPLRDNARGLIFFYHDPRTSRLKIHSIRDFL